jgi:hypothetical protein
MAFIAPVQPGDLIQASTINGLVDGSVHYSPDSGISNAYKVTFDGVTGPNKNKVSALTDGLMITFLASAANTGASTLEVLGPTGTLGTRPIFRGISVPLAPSDIRGSVLVAVIYKAALAGFQLLTPPVGFGFGASVALTSNVAMANMTWTMPNTMSTVSFDTGGFYSGAAPDRLTIPVGLSGLYLAIYTACFAANSNGLRYADIEVNGLQQTNRTVTVPTAASSTPVFIVIPLLLKLNSAEWIRGAAWQSSGGSLDLVGAGGTRLFLARINS